MRTLQIIVAIVLFFATPAMAKDGGQWIVAQKSGHVQVIRAGLQPASVQLRAALSPGDLIATGADGRAMLTRGDDYVIVAPASRLLLPQQQAQQNGFTRLIQQMGTMLYKVRHTGTPHFAVETPMLAAVVKGTSFTVIVDKDRAAVQVTEGLVEVSSAAGNARRLVEGGVTVYVGRERPTEIIEMKPGATIESPSSGNGETSAVRIDSSGEVPLSAITNLTAGLISEATVAPIAAVAKPAPTAGLPSTPVTGSLEPVVGEVEDAIAGVTDPVVEIVDPVVAPVVEPVVEIVETVVPPVVEPVVEVVETVVIPVVEPVVQIVETIVPVIPPVLPTGGLFGK